jgi:uncharacterized surface protein with fasciclin (FAS1) repeats
LHADLIFTCLAIRAGLAIGREYYTNGRRGSVSVVSSNQIRTMHRGFLQVSGTTPTNNLGRQAEIVATDVPAANGIIHAIDMVIFLLSHNLLKMMSS